MDHRIHRKKDYRREMRDPRYPIGKFDHAGSVSDRDLTLWISQIESLPAELRRGVEGLTENQLDTRYRPGGWTLRQVVHHLPDSHVNSYVRFKLALTEYEPTIKPYDEARWAELPDAKILRVQKNLVRKQQQNHSYIKRSVWLALEAQCDGRMSPAACDMICFRYVFGDRTGPLPER